MKHTSVVALAVLTAVAAGCCPWYSRTGAPKSWVEVYDMCKESVVVIGNAGSGFVIDESGYVMTNAHVLRQTPTVQLFDGSSHTFRIVAANISQDLALLKINANREFKPAKIGRSSELKVGQPVMAIGNPDKFNFTATVGIVSGLNRAARSEYSGFAGLIQTDAGINPGSSGGPLFNQSGEVVGVNTLAKPGADNLGFAINIDKALTNLPDIVLAPERRFGFALGLKLDPFRTGTVTQVKPASPAEAAGLGKDDVITHLDGQPLKRSLDFHLALIDRRPGDKLNLILERDGRSTNTVLTLGSVPQRPSEKVEGLVNGLRYEHYQGKWTQLPDFAKLKPVATGIADSFDVTPYKGKDFFAVRFSGYISVPADGTYTFYTSSDDGSRLAIGDRLLVDNDFTHATMEQQGRIALRAGLHPITVAFFEHSYGEELHVAYDGPGIKKQVIPALALSHVPARPLEN